MSGCDSYKRDGGSHPMLGFLDDLREALGAILRPGSVGSNTAIDRSPS